MSRCNSELVHRLYTEMDSASLRITLVGEGGVGKSALIVRFMTDRFLHHYDPTLEDEYKVSLKGYHDLTIKDTAGQGLNHMEYYCKTSDVFLVTFSVADFVSLQRAKELIGVICKHSCTGVVLVGTKSDLQDERQVSLEEGQSTANQVGVHYIETSAALGVNVEQAFKLAESVALSSTKMQSALEKKEHHRHHHHHHHYQSIKAVIKRWKTFNNDEKLLKSLS